MVNKLTTNNVFANCVLACLNGCFSYDEPTKSRFAATRTVTSVSIAVDDIISKDATFPNESFAISVQSLNISSDLIAPRQLNLSTLTQIGIKTDNSSLIAETERLFYFYIQVPPTVNNNRQISPSQSDTNISNIGIQFGNSTVIIVVPISGLVRVASLPDSSTVYQLKVKMPQSMCIGSSRSSTCNTITWKSYFLSLDAKSGNSGDVSTFSIACGSQCNSSPYSPCATTCDRCNAEEVSGADTPVTRRFRLGATSGTVNFKYQTYTVKDRITVVYESNILLDSGCIGTEGIVERNVSYSGASDEIRVDVEPNCEGTQGTQWFFQISCQQL